MKFQDFYLKYYNWVIAVGPRVMLAFLLLFTGLWIIRKIKKWSSNAIEKRDVDPSLRPFLLSFSNIFLQVALLLALMQVLGIEMTIFATVIGAFSVAAGLALSGTLQNFTSGILILLLKPFKVGDNIIAQGQEGLVTSIQIFYTLVTTFDNRTVVLPNSKLSNEVIINLSREGMRRLDVELKFGFPIPFEQVKSILESTLTEHKELLKEPVFQIGVSAIDPDGYKVMVNSWVKAHGYQDIKLELQQKIIQDLVERGIKLPGM
ncbi:MAG: mechanosensitive ion channel family protein [Segetibacter sp.]|nr:mechanosensitive ion channel family protein [Segetibacter sp.]